MPELLLVGAVVGGLLALGALSLASWELLFGTGLALLAIGLVLGVPAGIGYHVVLHRALAPRGALAERWWLRPDRFHKALTIDERRAVMRWFFAGAAGFLITITGCVVVLISVARAD